MLKLGYKASAEQFGPSELLEFGCTAEKLGFDSVFISDHFQPWRHTGGHAPGADQERFLRLYALEVLPLLRKAFV